MLRWPASDFTGPSTCARLPPSKPGTGDQVLRTWTTPADKVDVVHPKPAQLGGPYAGEDQQPHSRPVVLGRVLDQRRRLFHAEHGYLRGSPDRHS
jgi:hypothetical protein